MSAAAPASEFVADTVGILSRIEGRRMGAAAKLAFEAVEAGTAVIYVPAMVLAEILYLSEKQRISASLRDVDDYLRRFPNCQEYPMNKAVVESAARINDIHELHDRLIAGTARLLNLALITNDRIMCASASIRTLWW